MISTAIPAMSAMPANAMPMASMTSMASMATGATFMASMPMTSMAPMAVPVMGFQLVPVTAVAVAVKVVPNNGADCASETISTRPSSESLDDLRFSRSTSESELRHLVLLGSMFLNMLSCCFIWIGLVIVGGICSCSEELLWCSAA